MTVALHATRQNSAPNRARGCGAGAGECPQWAPEEALMPTLLRSPLLHTPKVSNHSSQEVVPRRFGDDLGPLQSPGDRVRPRVTRSTSGHDGGARFERVADFRPCAKSLGDGAPRRAFRGRSPARSSVTRSTTSTGASSAMMAKCVDLEPVVAFEDEEESHRERHDKQYRRDETGGVGEPRER